MFNNSGEKLKKVALIFFWVTVVAELITGIVVGTDYEDFLIALAIIVGGFLTSYISALVFVAIADAEIFAEETYGKYAKLLSKLDAMEAKKKPQTSTAKETKTPGDEAAVPVEGQKNAEPDASSGNVRSVNKCPKCGKTQFAGSATCFNCGTKLR